MAPALAGPTAPPAAAQAVPDTLRAYPLETPIDVDGRLVEEAWSRAMHITRFTQRELQVGRPATERTEVAVLYDSEALYIGFWGFDRNPGGIAARKMRRDFSWGSEDNFEVILDTYHDRRNGYLFVVNPNGAKADAAVIDNGSRVNKDWDGVWYASVRITDRGWFAELKIPLSTLKFPSLPEQEWGINFERNIRRKREQVLWQGWSRDSDLEQVARGGILTGLRGLTSVRLVEAKPYTLGGVENRRAAPWKTVSHVGGDVNYLLTPTVKLTLTVNPDFAQVEADRTQVNLTRFSLSYPEKREFFLEGREFFDFVLNSRDRPFFSRRVGLDRHGEPQTILGGARLLAKLGGTTLGAMSLETAGLDDTPATNFTVLRWKQDVLRESTVGLISVTKIQPGRINTTYGADLRYATSHLFGERSFAAGLSMAQSYTSDAAGRTGTAHRLFFNYPNDLVEFEGSWNRAGADFNPEVGFLRRRAYQEFYGSLKFKPRPGAIPWVRQMEFKPLDINYYLDDVVIPRDEYWYTRYELHRSLSEPQCGLPAQPGEPARRKL